MTEPISPSVGWGVLHLFCKPTPALDREALVAAVKTTQATGHQVICADMLGHKADVCIMGLGPDLRELRRLQSAVQAAGLEGVEIGRAHV